MEVAEDADVSLQELADCMLALASRLPIEQHCTAEQYIQVALEAERITENVWSSSEDDEEAEEQDGQEGVGCRDPDPDDEEIVEITAPRITHKAVMEHVTGVYDYLAQNPDLLGHREHLDNIRKLKFQLERAEVAAILGRARQSSLESAGFVVLNPHGASRPLPAASEDAHAP